MIYQYICQEKVDRPQNWLGMIGWKAFLAEEVNVTLLLRLHWDTCIQKSHTQWFYCNVTGSFKIINEHLHSGHLYAKIYKTLKNIDICLAGGFCPCPHPLSCTPLFVVSHSCLGTCL